MRIDKNLALATLVLLGACSGGQPAAENNAMNAMSAEPAMEATNNATAVVENAAVPAAPAVANTADADAKEVAEKAKKEVADAAAKVDAAAKKVEVAAAAPAPAPVAAPAAFNRCMVCHDAHKGGEDKLGPNLYGIYGVKAAKHRPGFNYSDALKGSGLTWNEDTLDKWIAKPAALVPGTYMSFPGISDAAKRKEIIDYLKSLK